MDYKKNSLQKEKNKKIIYIFFVTFFLSMFIVGLIIKTLTPAVDVEIGDNVKTEDNSDEIDNKGIDNRLKWIQFEDNMPGVSKRFALDNEASSDDEGYKTDAEKIEERVRTAKETTIKTDINEDSNEIVLKKDTKTTSPPIPKSADIVKQMNSPSAPVRMSKVYIGYYTSIEQAISTQNKLLDSSLNVSPFVKEVNGYYVVQVGSYANKQKAQSLAGEVSAMGFPTKIVSE